MGIITDALDFSVRNALPVPIPRYQEGLGHADGRFESYARSGYMGNEIVFSAINLLAMSAGEPHISGRRLRRERREVRNAIKAMKANGVPPYRISAYLAENKFVEELPDHPAVRTLNAPNPFMSRGQLWGTVIMDRMLAGNAYLVKARSMGMVAELWRLRPDRVKVVPSSSNYIEAYEYTINDQTTRIPKEDIIHFKTRHPLNEYYGMPPLMAASGRVDIDNYMRSFLRTFFERGGTGPGSILAVKQRITQEAKDQIRERFRRQFGGGSGFHEMLILDQAETTYSQLGLDRGLRDALPKEIDALQEARIAMVFGIPGSILGLLIGYESSSYANKRADWRVFWDVTMAPLLSDLDDVLNLHYIGDFNGIDEVYFDLDDIKALQDDVDAVQERERKNLMAGAITLEEYRDAIGRKPEMDEGLVYVPTSQEVKKASELGEEPEPPPVPEFMEPPEENGDMPMAASLIAEPRCPRCGRRNGYGVNVGARLMCRSCKMEFAVV